MNLIVDENSGGLAFWSTVRDVPRMEVLTAATAAGIERHVPATPPLSTALRDAMENIAVHYFGKRKHEPLQILQTAKPRTFECVRCVRGTDRNDHVFLFTAEVNANDMVDVVNANRGHYVMDDASGHCCNVGHLLDGLREEFDNQITMLPAATVTRVLALGMRDWNGQCLKDRGGLWFLPASCIESYRAWCDALQHTGCVFTYAQITMSKNPAFVGHLLDEVRDEVLAGVREIQEDMLNGSTSQDRSIRLRMQRSEEFLAKVKAYEDITGRTMQDIRDCVEGVKNALGMQKLLAVSA
jgi:hypothetical protein